MYQNKKKKNKPQCFGVVVFFFFFFTETFMFKSKTLISFFLAALYIEISIVGTCNMKPDCKKKVHSVYRFLSE